MAEDVVGDGSGGDALHVLTQWLFDLWDFHKIFAEVPEFTLARLQPRISDLGSGSQRFDIEAVVKEFWYYKGHMWDMYICGTNRRDWEARTP